MEIIQRMNALGLVDCISSSFGGPEPTYRPKAPKNATAIHQLDYVYADRTMLDRLAKVLVVRGALANRKRISDHFPVVCDFE